MPNDVFQQLDARIRKTDIDQIPSTNERVMTITVDFPKIDSFKTFIGANEQMWYDSVVKKFDQRLKSTDKVNLTMRTLKDTVYDERGMVAVIVRYTVN